jgi:putative alpha-1,2-mannosidase
LAERKIRRLTGRFSGWTEGDAWVYTWSPLHDQAGLLQLMGGAEAYDAKLDEPAPG